MRWYRPVPSIPITLPDLGCDRISFSLWYVRPGDRVYEGDRVAEVLIPGATFDVPSPATGRFTAGDVFSGDPVHAGQCLGRIDPD